MCIAADLNFVKVGDAIEDLVSMSAVLSAVATHFVISSLSCCHLWILVDGRDYGSHL